MDDLLKSLVVADPAGPVAGLRLPARDLAAEAFRGLPLRQEDFADRVRLFGALRGQEVTAAGVTGRIAEAAELPRVPGLATGGGLRLTLLTPTGLTAVVLEEGAEARLADAALAARIARAAEALAAAQSESERRVEIRLRADRVRTVSVTTVTGAPLWKPSWRLLVPEMGQAEARARLQGWAVVENRSGTDWDGVRLTLVAGEAAAYRQSLYTPLLVERPELPVRVAEAVQVEADTGARPAPPPPPAPAPAFAAEARRDRLGAAPPAMAAAPALAAASAGRIAFALPETVTLRSGETANLPFLDAGLPAERVWWVQDLAARHPLQAVRVTNAGDSTLPDGIATVYGVSGAEAGGFLGDAEIRAMPPGATRLLAFARDRDVLLTAGGGATDRPVRAELQPGRVVVHLLRVEEVALAVDPRGARGRLIVDLPRRPGATPRFAVAAEGDFGLRHEAVVEGPTTLRLPFERAQRQEVPLWDPGLGDPLLLSWRRIDVERELRRLPGGPATLESLRATLERMAPDAPGREGLARIADRLAAQRGLLEAFRAAARTAATSEAALTRARAAVEDRTGPAREKARQALNRASVQADRAGAAADAAWEAWQRGAAALLSAAE
ncbi:DUF4139 domain-containing protein [Roseomonas sp. OT10]|uniref:DUF4139 domain-containing protein n=1 Tax=Roseomonas cutis TaxID=2897332 RepID=UPI001E3DC0C3|nr:DUF4139 domain-containing protein [Roseomonas sp. OT10]UFN51280.1 DUF4139 domain-containing protein [Roseomonas sp. OT10]